MKNKIVCTSPSKILLDNEIYGGVTYYKSINASTDLQLGQVSSAQVSFKTSYSGITKNTYFEYWTWQECDSDWRKIGIYYVDDIKKDRNMYTITAYDCICKLDRDFTAELSICNVNTLENFFKYICDKCGLSYPGSPLYTNKTMPVDPKSLITPGITARTLMGYIAEATGSFIYTRDDNLVHCWVYEAPSPAVSLTDDDYVNLDMAKEPAPAITGVTVQLANGASYTSGSGSSILNILYNPLFYNKSANQVATYVNNVKNIVDDVGNYYPCSFHCFSDMKLKNGDIITVNGQRTIIMSKRITADGCDFSCTGNPTREPLVQQNTDRITNLEANRGDDKYLTLDWLTSNSDKTFNSVLTVNDIIIPSGLGYGGNPFNTSLVEVIQAILGHFSPAWGPGSTSYTYNMISDNGPYHVLSNVLDGSYSKSGVTGDITVSAQIVNTPYTITCTGSNNGQVKFTKSGVTFTYYINCYTNMYSQNETYYRSYPGVPSLIDYDKIRTIVYYNSLSTPVFNDRGQQSSEGTGPNNSYLEMFYGDSEGWTLKFKLAGTYTIEVYDVEDRLAVTLKFLSQ